MSDTSKRRSIGRGYRAVLEAKQRLQINRTDSEAIDILRGLSDVDFLITDHRTKRKEINPVLGPVSRNPELFLELLQRGELVERKQGEFLCCKNDDADDTMFVILNGHLAVLLPHGNVALEAGDLVGEMAFALRSKRTASVEIVREASLLSLNASELPNTIRKQIIRECVAPRLVTNLVEGASIFSSLHSSERAVFVAKALAPKIRLIQLDSNRSIRSEHDDYRAGGLYLLCGGILDIVDNDNAESRPIVGPTSEPPILYASFDGELSYFHRRFRSTRKGASIVHIPEDLVSVIGHEPADELLKRVKSQIVAQYLFDVFISYTGSDKQDARLLKSRLETADHSVFMDEQDRPGRFDAKLEQAIAESLLFVPLISEHTHRNPEWVKREIRFRKNCYSRFPHIYPLQLTGGRVEEFDPGNAPIEIRRTGIDGAADELSQLVSKIRTGRTSPPLSIGRVDDLNILQA